jgi:hypothetical protein
MAAALLMVSNAVPQLRGQARDLLAPMDFGSYYDPAAGLLAALGNELAGDRLQRYLTGGRGRAGRPALLAMEEFTAGG